MLPISLSVLIWSSSFSWLINVPATTRLNMNTQQQVWSAAAVGRKMNFKLRIICYQLRLQTARAQGPRRGTGGEYGRCLSLRQEPESLSPPLPGSRPVSFQTWACTHTNFNTVADQFSPLLQCIYQIYNYRVSRALRLLLRGCCSRQLTAGLPAVGRVIALSTRLVMACTANTFNWVRSKSSYRPKYEKYRDGEQGGRKLVSHNFSQCGTL